MVVVGLFWGRPKSALATHTNLVHIAPDRKGVRRIMDFSTVFLSFAYGSYWAFRLPSIPWTLGWCIMLGGVALIFGVNEARFWTRKDKTLRDYRIVIWV